MAHITLRNLVASRPDLTRRKKKGVRAKPVRPSRKDELWYKASLRAIVAQLKAATNAALLPLLKAHESSYAKDSMIDDLVAKELEKLAAQFGDIDGIALRLANEAARRALQNTDTVLAKSIKAVTGVDITPALTMAPDVQQALDFHTRANIDLITSIPDQYFEKIQESITKNFQAGMRYEDIAEDIARVGGITDSRANLIARDQTSKMNGAFNEVRQTDLGIEGYIWQGAEDERERETHLANEGLFFRWDSPPPETGHPGDDIQCFPGDSQIQFADDIKKAYRRWFRGELAEIVTASGKTLRGTVNHPVLTLRGWVALGQLDEADYVVEIAHQVLFAAEENENDKITSIAQIFEAVEKHGIGATTRLRRADFHGDGADSNVDIVGTTRRLDVNHVSAKSQDGGYLRFPGPDDSATSLSASDPVSASLEVAPRGAIGRFGQVLTLLWGKFRHTKQVGGASISQTSAGPFQTIRHNDPLNTHSFGDGEHAISRRVSCENGDHVDRLKIGRETTSTTIRLDAGSSQSLRENIGIGSYNLGGTPQSFPFVEQANRVVNMRRIYYEGHVYNLETRTGWYVTNGIVTHNCRCIAIPYFDLG